jgi:SAM-dependent methyltransferase
MMTTPRRLIFGEVAQQYDSHRPTYPDAVADDLVALSAVAPGATVVEVGAGTGKATVLFAARGFAVLAIEPSAEMAAVAARNCAGYPAVRIVETDFERWDPAGERFALIYSAQAWHWVDPLVGYARARAALREGGVLGAFWNRPAWGPSAVRTALAEVYAALAPELSSDQTMHPANPQADDEDGWSDDIARGAGFGAPEWRRYGWTASWTAPAYAGLLGTLSEHRLLDPPRREALLGAVTATIEDHGGILEIPMATVLVFARAV